MNVLPVQATDLGGPHPGVHADCVHDLGWALLERVDDLVDVGPVLDEGGLLRVVI